MDLTPFLNAYIYNVITNVKLANIIPKGKITNLEEILNKYIISLNNDISTIVNKSLSEKSSPSSRKNKKDSTDPKKLSGYNFFLCCLSKKFKELNIKFSMSKKFEPSWNNLDKELKESFNSKAISFNLLTREEQNNIKNEIIDELYLLIKDIKLVTNSTYEYNFDSYRRIRKGMKENNNFEITEKLNVYWNLIKKDNNMKNTFFQKYAHFDPEFNRIDNESDNINYEEEYIDNKDNMNKIDNNLEGDFDSI